MPTYAELLAMRNKKPATREASSGIKILGQTYQPGNARVSDKGISVDLDVVDPITGKPLKKDGGFTKADRDAIANISTLNERLKMMRTLWDDFDVPEQPTMAKIQGGIRNFKAGQGYDSKVKSFEAWRKPLTRGFARAFGEKGVLTDKDVMDFENTIPSITTDSKQDAEDKWAMTDEMLSIASKKLYEKTKIKVIDANAPEVQQ
jgi:hypothetical protein